MVRLPTCLVLAVLVGMNLSCIDGGTKTPARTDNSVPSVIYTRPFNNQAAVQAQSPLVVEFSEFMSRDTVKVTVSPSVDLQGVEWKTIDAQDSLTLRPAAPWPENTLLTVSISGSDLAGNALPPASFRFTTSTKADSCAAIACDPMVADRCEAGSCVCGTLNSACSTGQVCTQGTCVAECTSANCSNGCCDKGLCYTFNGLPDGGLKTDALHCGTGGVACRADTDNRADRCTSSGTLACGPGINATICAAPSLPYCDASLGMCTCPPASQSCSQLLGLKSKVFEECCPSGNWCSACSNDDLDMSCSPASRTGETCAAGAGTYTSVQVN